MKSGYSNAVMFDMGVLGKYMTYKKLTVIGMCRHDVIFHIFLESLFMEDRMAILDGDDLEDCSSVYSYGEFLGYLKPAEADKLKAEMMNCTKRRGEDV